MAATSEILLAGAPTGESAELGANDDPILTALQSTTRSMSTSGCTKARQDYESRLLSFQTSTYCAKPACLSPLLCARFGWRNADRDMLCCSSCKVAVAVTLPSGLSGKATERICSAYREQLSSAHKQHCPFRLEAEQFFRSERLAEATLSIPTAYSLVLPQETVKLLEHPSPSELLSKKIRDIESLCPSEQPHLRFPKLEIADEIQNFEVTIKDDAKIPAVEALSATVDLLGTEHISVSVAAILGWTPVTAKADLDPESQSPIASLGCPLCLATMEISLDDDRDSANRLPKRQKRLARFCNPHDAHRYYCPFRCGFPKNVLTSDAPLWQALLSRLVSERETNKEIERGGYRSSDKLLDPEQAVSRIRTILMSGIVSKKVELEIDDGLGDSGS